MTGVEDTHSVNTLSFPPIIHSFTICKKKFCVCVSVGECELVEKAEGERAKLAEGKRMLETMTI